MNVFRIAADALHILSFIILYYKIWKTGSCAGLSGKTQVLYTTVFITRYLDLFLIFISMYNTMMKIVFILASSGIVYLIYFKFKSTYNKERDTFWLECPYFLAVILALRYNHADKSFFELETLNLGSCVEVFWAFSIYLEAFAIVPQLFMIYKNGKMECFVPHYLTAMLLYRGFYILNWIYRYDTTGYYDLISICGGVVQTTVYIIFFFLYMMKIEGMYSLFVSYFHLFCNLYLFNIDDLQKKTIPDLDDRSKTVWI